MLFLQGEAELVQHLYVWGSKERAVVVDRKSRIWVEGGSLQPNEKIGFLSLDFRTFFSVFCLSDRTMTAFLVAATSRLLSDRTHCLTFFSSSATLTWSCWLASRWSEISFLSLLSWETKPWASVSSCSLLRSMISSETPLWSRMSPTPCTRIDMRVARVMFVNWELWAAKRSKLAHGKLSSSRLKRLTATKNYFVVHTVHLSL